MGFLAKPSGVQAIRTTFREAPTVEDVTTDSFDNALSQTGGSRIIWRRSERAGQGVCRRQNGVVNVRVWSGYRITTCIDTARTTLDAHGCIRIMA